nr:hypothetical protein CFP56_38852 [Quercus suber]
MDHHAMARMGKGAGVCAWVRECSRGSSNLIYCCIVSPKLAVVTSRTVRPVRQGADNEVKKLWTRSASRTKSLKMPRANNWEGISADGRSSGFDRARGNILLPP